MRVIIAALALALASSPSWAGKCTYVGGNGAQPECVDNNMPIGSLSTVTAQATVTSTAALAVPARLNRNMVTIENLGVTPVFIGPAGVTTSTGYMLPGVAGATVTIPTQAALYAVTASGTATLAVLEVY